MKMTLTIFLILFITIGKAQKVYPTEQYALANGQLIDLDHDRIMHATVLVSEGLISDIITPEGEIPEGYQVIDLNGKFIHPGMIDVHTHLSSLQSARIALLSGVTTVRSAGVSAFQDVSLMGMVENGHLEGPDVVPAGVYVTPNLGESILADPRLAHLGDPVDDESELRKVVQVNIDRGAKVIKTRGTERAGLPETDPRKQTYTTEQLSWVIDEASKADVQVMIHAHGDEGARAAVQAGAKSIEHGTYLSIETLELMKEKDVFLVPTFITLLDLIEPGGDYDNPVIHMRGKYMIPKSRRAIVMADSIGVKIATGADNRYTTQSTSRVSMEVEEYMKMGMDPWKALKTTTVNAAELLKVDDHTGRIVVGLEADLIVLPDNPLTEPKALQDVLLIMSNGHLVLNRMPFGLAE